MAAIPGILGTITTTSAMVRGVAQDFSQQGNGGLGVETALHTYTVPAGGLAVDGDSIHFEYWGTIPSASSDSRIRLTFGSTVLFDTTAFDPALTVGWHLHGRLVRTGATAQKGSLEISIFEAGIDGGYYFTAAETLSGALDLKLLGNGTASSDVVKQGAVINFRGVAP